jgi:hypothetical protein
MKLNGKNNTKILRRDDLAPIQFLRGPLRIVSHVSRHATVPCIAAFINETTEIKLLPAYFELQAPQNFIDFRIMNCDADFISMIVSYNIIERMSIKFNRSHGNITDRVYRLFPTGTLQRLK